MKRDSLGRERQPSQSAAGNKPLPSKSHGCITGDLEAHEMPGDIDDNGIIFWTSATESMRKLGILERMDWTILAMAADAYSRWMAAKIDVARYGNLLSSESGELKRNPAFLTLKENAMMLKSYLTDMGMTPSARAKFGPVEEDDAFERLMRDAN